MNSKFVKIFFLCCFFCFGFLFFLTDEALAFPAACGWRANTVWSPATTVWEGMGGLCSGTGTLETWSGAIPNPNYIESFNGTDWVYKDSLLWGCRDDATDHYEPSFVNCKADMRIDCEQGLDNGLNFTPPSAPTRLCRIGTVSDFAGGGTSGWTWKCVGNHPEDAGVGGSNPNVCYNWAGYTAPVCTEWYYYGWGACQPGNFHTRGYYSTYPSNCEGGNPIDREYCLYSLNGACNNTSAYACSSGTSINNNLTGGTYTWSCQGVGAGTTASCSFTPCTSCTFGACSSGSKSCTAGTYLPSGCTGSNFTTTVSCGTPGVCNNTAAYLCTSGTAINQSQSGSNYTWNCHNSDGGADSACSYTAAAVPTCTTSTDGVATVYKCTGTGSTTWTVPVGITQVKYLVVAGGGAGGGAGTGAGYGSANGGGGGGGGFLTGSGYAVTPGASLPITVGAGGASVSSWSGGNGGDSVFSTNTSKGGGGGGFLAVGKAGGSAGGGGGGDRNGDAFGAGTASPAGQGNNGGYGSTNNLSGSSGGGGGASAAGGSSTNVEYAGNGGAGIASTITGTNTYYSGGGAGGAWVNTSATGGLGGGGNGVNRGRGGAGTNGFGGGGAGSGSYGGGLPGGDGGSGTVVLRYAQTAYCSSAGPDSVTVSGTTHDVFAYGVGNASTVYFPTWTTANGQDDIKWYLGTNLGGGTWKASIDFAANHNNEMGEYNTHVYVDNSLLSSWCDTANFTRVASLTAPSIITITGATTINEGDTIGLTVNASGTAPLTYNWAYSSNPAGSPAPFTNSGTATQTFIAPQVTGDVVYTCSVIVNNSTNIPATATTIITVKDTTVPAVTANTLQNPKEIATGIGNSDESCWYCEHYKNTATTVAAPLGGAAENLQFKFTYHGATSMTGYQIAFGTSSDVNAATIKSSAWVGASGADGAVVTVSSVNTNAISAKRSPNASLSQLAYGATYHWWVKVQNAGGESAWIQGTDYAVVSHHYPIVKIVPVTGVNLRACTTVAGAVGSFVITDPCYAACGAASVATANDLENPAKWKCSVCYDETTNTPKPCGSGVNTVAWTLPSTAPVGFGFKPGSTATTPNPLFSGLSTGQNVNNLMLEINGSSCPLQGGLTGSNLKVIWNNN
jgi:hypothetical protein